MKDTNIIYYRKEIIVELCGEVDHHVAPGIKDRIDFMAFECNVKKIVFDFSKVTFMDSSGIGIVLGRYNKMIASGGEVVTRNAHGTVKQILEMCGIFSLMKYEEDEKEAEK